MNIENAIHLANNLRNVTIEVTTEVEQVVVRQMKASYATKERCTLQVVNDDEVLLKSSGTHSLIKTEIQLPLKKLLALTSSQLNALMASASSQISYFYKEHNRAHAKREDVSFIGDCKGCLLSESKEVYKHPSCAIENPVLVSRWMGFQGYQDVVLEKTDLTAKFLREEFKRYTTGALHTNDLRHNASTYHIYEIAGKEVSFQINYDSTKI